jgi:RNA polymerase sigma-70 factor (ECF subfamily)
VVVTDRNDIELLLNGNIEAYEVVYKNFFKPLYVYAYSMLNDEMKAEEVVQTIFLKLWEKQETIDIQTSLKAYLYRSVHNASLNVIKHEKVKQQYETYATHAMKTTKSETPAHTTMYKNLENKLREALNELPEQCRTVFQLSRFEELKYREIAERLSISEKTVEGHMGKALKLLRMKLVDFIVVLILLFIHLKNNIL